VGSAGPAESLRLRAELATRRADLIAAYAQVQAARVGLNQVLNRPLETPVTTVGVDEASAAQLARTGTLAAYLARPRDFERLRDVLSAEAVRRVPEVQALEAAVRAQERAQRAARRAFYVPDVAAFAQLTSLLYDDGAGSGGLALPSLPTPPGEGFSFPEFPNTFWTAGLSVTLPLFEGTGRLARRDRASAEVARLRLERDLVAQRVEQQVRAQLLFAAAAYEAVQEARRAADASRRSLAIVTDAYAAGALEVTPLLEAQNATLRADAAVTNAIYDLLLDVKRAERAVGYFEALSTPRERAAFQSRLDEALRSDTSVRDSTPE
jgi:outer membrane protein TolC